ncbi:MAG: DNA-binding transcriptional LysR family regulator [Moritella sp.]
MKKQRRYTVQILGCQKKPSILYVIITVAEEGSSVKAGYTLNKSQSAICHSIKKMESILGHSLFIVEGRRSVLTELGRSLLPKAQSLQNRALQTETFAKKYQGNLINEINIAVDVLLPLSFVCEVIERFNVIFPNVSVRIYETSLSGASDLLSKGSVSLAIASLLPKNTILESLMEIEMVCVCSPESPLAKQNSVTQQDLKEHRHLIIRDSGNQDVDSGWLGSHHRLTVSNPFMAMTCALKNIGFGWLPEHLARPHLLEGTLVLVNLAKGANRTVRLHLGMNADLAHVDEINTLFELFDALKTTDFS